LRWLKKKRIGADHERAGSLLNESRKTAMTYLFTIVAFFAVGTMALFADRQHRLDTDGLDTDAMQTNTKQVRQELRMITYLLAAIVIFLGITPIKFASLWLSARGSFSSVCA
jgi:hypothetical protein